MSLALTACKAFCWRTYFLICRSHTLYYSRHWKTFPQQSDNFSLPPSLGCAAGIFTASSSNGRGYGNSRRLPRLSLCSVSPASPPCYRWAAVRRQLLSSWLFISMSYDYDPARAAMLALLQMVCCLGLVLLSQRLSKPYTVPRCCKAGAIRTIVCIAAFATRC